MNNSEKYTKIRDKNSKEHIRRFNYVLDNFNDIRQLIETRRRLQNSFDLVLSGDTAFKKYTDDVKAINSRIKELLEVHSLPCDFLEPIYTCPVCEDKGFYYDKEIIPRRCKCNNENYFAFSFNDFKLELFSKKKADGYSSTPYSNMQKILEFAKEYCSRFPEVPIKNIMFYGASGLGKSFLASCMCSELQAKGFSPVKVNAFKLVEDFKEKHVHDTAYPENYFKCDFLVIDDIGTEPMYKNITTEYLFSLINERTEQRLATVFITNLSFEHCCNRYDERLASRMFDSTNTKRIMFFGDNLRLRK